MLPTRKTNFYLVFAYLIALFNLCDGLDKVSFKHPLVAVSAAVEWGFTEGPVGVGVFPAQTKEKLSWCGRDRECHRRYVRGLSRS